MTWEENKNNRSRRQKMKKLLEVFVVLAVLAVCAPSNGYILVYKLTSTVKAVDADVNSLGNVKVKGYLALDIDDVEEIVADAQMVIYGVDGDANKIYYVENFQGVADAIWTEEGDYLTFNLTNHRDPFYYDIVLTGKIKEKDVGFGGDDMRSTSSSLKGVMTSTSGILFDLDQTLFGSGSASMTLDNNLTKAANDLAATVDQVITSTVEGDGGLIEKGYELLVIP